VIAKPVRRVPSSDVARRVAGLVRRPRTALLLGGSALNPRGLEAAARLSAATGVRVHIARNVARIWSGRGRFQPEQIPYFPEPAIQMLRDLENLILVEAKIPVSFFGYPRSRSWPVSMKMDRLRWRLSRRSAERQTPRLSSEMIQCSCWTMGLLRWIA
jgi:hypothetical protein